MDKDKIWSIIKDGEGLREDQFLAYLAYKFNLPAHKWTIDDDENAPLYSFYEKVVLDDKETKVIEYDIDNHGNVGYIKYINYKMFSKNE